MKPATKCPLVMIEWVDSVLPRSRWDYLTDIGRPEAVRCVSVGWLVADHKNIKSLAPNMGAVDTSDSLQVSGLITIPMQAIIKITRLKEPRLSRGAFSLAAFNEV